MLSYGNRYYASKSELAAWRMEAICYQVGHQLSERPKTSDRVWKMTRLLGGFVSVVPISTTQICTVNSESHARASKGQHKGKESGTKNKKKRTEASSSQGVGGNQGGGKKYKGTETSSGQRVEVTASMDPAQTAAFRAMKQQHAAANPVRRPVFINGVMFMSQPVSSSRNSNQQTP